MSSSTTSTPAATPARRRPSSAPTPPTLTPSAETRASDIALYASPRRLSASRIATPSSAHAGSSSLVPPTSDDCSTTPRQTAHSSSRLPSARPSPLAATVASPSSAAAISKSAPPSATPRDFHDGAVATAAFGASPRASLPRTGTSGSEHEYHQDAAAVQHPHAASVSPNRRLSDSALADNIRMANRSARHFPHTPGHPRGLLITTPMTARSANKAAPGRDPRRASDIGVVPTSFTIPGTRATTRSSQASLERAQWQLPMWMNLPPCIRQSIPITTTYGPALNLLDAGDGDLLFKLATGVIAAATIEDIVDDDDMLKRKVGMFQAALDNLESNYPPSTDPNDNLKSCMVTPRRLRRDLIQLQAVNPHLRDLTFRVTLASFIAYCTSTQPETGEVHRPIRPEEYLALAELCVDDFDMYAESHLEQDVQGGQLVQTVRRNVNMSGAVARLAMVFLCLAFDSGVHGKQLYNAFHQDLATLHAMWSGVFDLWKSHSVSPTAHSPEPMPAEVREQLRQLVWERVNLLAPSISGVTLPPTSIPGPIKTEPTDGTDGSPARGRSTTRKRSRLSDPVPLPAPTPAPLLDLTADSDLDEDEMEKQAQQQHLAFHGGHRVTASGAHKRAHTASSTTDSEPYVSPAREQSPPFKRLRRGVDESAATEGIGASPGQVRYTSKGMPAGGRGAWNDTDKMDVDDDRRLDSDAGPFFPAPRPPPPAPQAFIRTVASSSAMAGVGDMVDDYFMGHEDVFDHEQQGTGGATGHLSPLRRTDSLSPGRQDYLGASSSAPTSNQGTPVRDARAAAAATGDAGGEEQEEEGDQPRGNLRRRTPRQRWTHQEEAILEIAMREHMTGWAAILHAYPEQLGRFSQMQLKDKARNLRARREKAGKDLGVFQLATRYPSKTSAEDREQQEGGEEEERQTNVARQPRRRAADEDEDDDDEWEVWPIREGMGDGRMTRQQQQQQQPLALGGARTGDEEEDEDTRASQQGAQNQELHNQEKHNQDKGTQPRRSGRSQHSPARPTPRARPLTRSVAAASKQKQARDGSKDDGDEYRPEQEEEEEEEHEQETG